MDANTLLSQALGLGGQWNVVKSKMDVPQRHLRLKFDFPAGTKFGCLPTLMIDAPLANFAEEFAGVADQQKRAAVFDQGIEEPRIRLTA